MIGSRRQEWIFEFIKGPDIVPVERCCGKYFPRRRVTIVAGDEAFEVGPGDILDFSNRSHLLIQASGESRKLAWDAITGLTVEDIEGRAETLTEPEAAVALPVFQAFATGKKAP